MKELLQKIFLIGIAHSLMAAPSDDFIIHVKTDNPGVSSSTEFTIPITNTNGQGYNVTCDDPGVVSSFNETGSYTCVYGSAGSYDIRISDANGDKKGFRRIEFYVDTATQTDAQKLIDIKQWGTAIWSSMNSAFRSASNTIASATDVPDLSSVGSLSNMFRDCTQVDPDTSSWDTSNITNLSYMFRNASNANPDVSSWNTSSVTNMRDMFYSAVLADPDTTNWDTANVTRMDNMFRDNTTANPNTSNWNTANVTEMDGMFYNAINANPDTSNWNTSNVTRFDNIFRDAAVATPNTINWNTSNVIEMDGMFYNAVLANPDTTSWNTANVTRFDNIFRNAPVSTPNTSNWDTSSAIEMDGMFYGASSANPDVSNWDTSNVTTMYAMFYSATSAEPVTTTNLNVWNTSNVTNMRYMFRNTPLANPDVSGWDMGSVTVTANMFQDTSVANPDVTNWNTALVTNISSMFRNASSFDRNMSGWNVSSITLAGSFLRGVQLTQANYDALLSSWGNQVVQTGVTFHGGTSQYCSGEGGRNVLVANSWSITDGGKNCGGVCASAVGELTENHWTTISFPCSTGANGIEALIGTAIGGTYGDNDNWVVYEQRGDYTGTSESMVLLNATDTVEPAKGYWIISDHNTTWHIDGNLTDLNYTPTVTASSLGISSVNFDYVHLRDLPDTAADEQKLLLGNPFPHDINISNIYFSGAGTAFSPMDGNANNDPYVNDVVYTYDHVGDAQSAYQAISASTPGFDAVIHQQGFWLRLKPGQVDTNRLTYPQAK